MSYYINTVGSLRAESKLSAQQVSEPFVHPDLTFNLSDEPFPAEGQYCLACHQGIEPARPIGSEMMQQILQKGEALGDPNGCVICHGGTPTELVNKDSPQRYPKGAC